MRLGSSLHDEAVVRVLERVRAEGAIEDDRATERLRAREAEVGSKVYGRERAELYGCAPISVTAEVGALLYLLARSRDARMVVEFGTSLGVSAIYLAAALRDAGVGSLVTTELLPEKARGAARNVADAGLGDLVEIRVGDALATLTRFDRTIDLLFLDGSNDVYLPVLRLVEPHLSRGALIAADMSSGDPHHVLYRDFVRDPGHGYVTVEVPLDDGVVLSVAVP